MQLPTPSDLFQGKYRIHQVIGKGGFATVYRATDEEVGRDVALKVLSPKDGAYPDAVVARFLREARLLAELQDPHTITMFDFGRTDDGLLFMAFEYVSGLDLQEVLKRREKLPPKEVRHILIQVLYALREAHDAGVFHRDIKPPNLLIYEYMGDPWRVKLLDFGVAKPVDSHAMGAQNLTRDGAMVGTPRYMAPEQIYGHDLTPAADIYSLGLVAYEMLLGYPAMDAKTNKERVRQQLTGPQKKLPDIGDSRLRRVVNKMILRDPLERYQSANSAILALRGKEEPEPRPTKRRKPVEAKKPPPWRKIVAVGVATAAVGLLTLAVLRLAKSSDKPVEIGQRQATGLQAVLQTSKETESATAAQKPATQEPEVAVPPTPPPAREVISGCSKEPPATGYMDRSTVVGFDTRAWLAYVPRTYDSSRRYPVMLLFHNFLNEPRKFLDMTRMAEIAEAEGFVIIAPKQTFATEDVEGVQLMLDEASEDFCLDRNSVYAVGHGRGGFFALDLACYMPLAGVAATGAGQRAGEIVCRSKEPVPMIRFHGDKDPIIPPKGGRGCLGGDYVARADINDEYVRHYGCKKAPKPWFADGDSVCTAWACGDDVRYVSCELDGGHSWPGGPTTATLPNCRSPAPDFPLRETIWRFLVTEGRATR